MMDATISIAEMYLKNLELPTTSVLMQVVVSLLRDPKNRGKGPTTRREVAQALLVYLHENPCSHMWLQLVDAKIPALVDIIEFYLWGNQSLDDILQVCITRVCCELHIMAAMVMLCAGDVHVRRLLSKRCTSDILGPMITWIMGQDNIQMELSRMDIGYTGPLHITGSIVVDAIVTLCCYTPMRDTTARSIVTHHLSILQDPVGRAWEVDRVTIQALGILVDGGHIRTLPETHEHLERCMDDVILLLRDPEAFLFEQSQRQTVSKPAQHLQNIVRSRVQQHDDKITTESCTLCMEGFKVEDPVVTLPCGHIFHDTVENECVGILMWLKGGTHCTGSGTCPLCLHRVDDNATSTS